MTMARFRKRPIEIDAIPVVEALTAASQDWSALPEWLREDYEAGEVLFLPHAVEIRTLEGTMRADHGDWIIRGVKGELYPCKPDIFEATYEAVTA
jgi:hypothetical protein